jgi:hypothetical protein
VGEVMAIMAAATVRNMALSAKESSTVVGAAVKEQQTQAAGDWQNGTDQGRKY